MPRVAPRPRCRTCRAPRLSNVKAVTRYEIRGQDYYFNSRNTSGQRLLSGHQARDQGTIIAGHQGTGVQKVSANNVSAAFAKRSACVVQGFYLTPDDKFVSMTTYDYICP